MNQMQIVSSVYMLLKQHITFSLDAQLQSDCGEDAIDGSVVFQLPKVVVDITYCSMLGLVFPPNRMQLSIWFGLQKPGRCGCIGTG